jgi:phage-related protein
MIKSITINNLITLQPNRVGIFSLKNVDGIATPKYRTTSLIYAGKNGGEVPDQKYGQRLVTFEGGINEDNCSDHLQARQDLLSAISFNVNVPILITTSNDDVYLMYAKFEEPTLPIEAKTFTDFQLTAIADDWRLLKTTSGEINEVTVYKLVDGGARWRTGADGAGWRWLTGSGLRWNAGAGAVNAINDGTTISNPIITITGANQNPIIRNNTTGEQIQINITTGVSDVIEIDTLFKSTKLNGGNINALVESDSTYFGLQPGDNLITLLNDNADGGQATIEWYDAVIGF